MWSCRSEACGPPQRLVCDGEPMPRAQAREIDERCARRALGQRLFRIAEMRRSVTNAGGSASASEYQVGVATTARPGAFGAADAVRRILEREAFARVEAELAQRFDDRRRARV